MQVNANAQYHAIVERFGHFLSAIQQNGNDEAPEFVIPVTAKPYLMHALAAVSSAWPNQPTLRKVLFLSCQVDWLGFHTLLVLQ